MATRIDKKFRVSGAGEIRIGATPTSLCGDQYGFSFGVSWGAHGFTGGTLGIEQARALARHILDQTDGLENTEDELRAAAMQRILAGK